jgi:molecular chaperone DnaK
MYLGIDLGTSNSAIVGNDRGTLRHFKTAEGTDVLASAIMIDRRGSMLVGKRAYDQAAFSPENVAQGFKLLMGTASPITFASNGRNMSPEEASAEVLKALVAQAHMMAGDFEIDGAVVTVPAAFNQMQSEATMRAAAAAGLPRVALLQEPIAAAMASIANSKNKNGQFLVYDLGGGTFDVAIVQTVARSATVISHAGINMLGGRDFDRALVNSVVRPWLFEQFDLPEDFQKDMAYQRLLRVAQYRAELAKIALSTQLSDRIFADENQIGARDRRGQEIYLDVDITREEMEALISEDINRSIDLSRKLLAESGYRNEDIDRVVLIGGPSRMPIVRERIGRDLGIRIDLDTDPMTAVALGAAIFAESREWAGENATTKNSRGSKAVKGPIDIRYDYPERTSDGRARIRITAGSALQHGGWRIQADTEDGWTSGQIPLDGLTEIVRDIPLIKNGENRIRVTVFDRQGVPRPDASTELVIFRAGASAAGMPMTHDLAVKVVTGPSGAERNILVTLVKKGTVLPAKGSERFRAARDLRAGDGKCLDFEVYQQAEGVDDPALNLPVGMMRISSDQLDKGDVIRRGDEVYVNWEVDENGLLNCELQFPSINKTYEKGKMYISAMGHKSFEGENGLRLATDALADATEDVDRLERALGAEASDAVAKLRSRLARKREALKLSYDAETRRSVSEEGLLIRQEVLRIKNKPKFVRSAIRSDIDQFVEGFAIHYASEVDANINAQIHRLAGYARNALVRASPDSVEEARRSLEEIRDLLFGALAKQPGFWVARFEGLAEDRHLAIDKERHDRLVAESEAAVRSNDIDAVRQLTFRLSENMVHMGGPGQGETLAGFTHD